MVVFCDLASKIVIIIVVVVDCGNGSNMDEGAFIARDKVTWLIAIIAVIDNNDGSDDDELFWCLGLNCISSLKTWER